MSKVEQKHEKNLKTKEEWRARPAFSGRAACLIFSKLKAHYSSILFPSEEDAEVQRGSMIWSRSSLLTKLMPDLSAQASLYPTTFPEEVKASLLGVVFYVPLSSTACTPGCNSTFLGMKMWLTSRVKAPPGQGPRVSFLLTTLCPDPGTVHCPQIEIDVYLLTEWRGHCTKEPHPQPHRFLKHPLPLQKARKTSKFWSPNHL